jgi:hypothetical protein
LTRHTPLWLQNGIYAASVDRHLFGALWPAAASHGLDISAVAGTMTVNIGAGAIAVPTASPYADTLCVSDATETVTLNPAPGAGLERRDMIGVQVRGNDLDGGANEDFIFVVTEGVPAPPPANWPAAANPPNLYYIGGYIVPGGAASLDGVDLQDWRPGNLAVPPASVPTDISHLPRGYRTMWTAPTTQQDIGPGTGYVGAYYFPSTPGRYYRISAYFEATITGGPIGWSCILRVNGANSSAEDGSGLRQQYMGGNPALQNGSDGTGTFCKGGASFIVPCSTPFLHIYNVASNLGIVGGNYLSFAAYSSYFDVEDVGDGAP